MSTQREREKYFAPHKRFPRTAEESSTKIGRMSSIAKCLDEALTEIIQEQNHIVQDENSEEGSLGRDENENGIKIDDKFKNNILDKFGAATSEAFYSEDETGYSASDEKISANTSASEIIPPAGLLRGKIKYYNRYHGQWRIVVSDAVIRPRVNVNYKKLRKREKISLEKNSRLHMEDVIRKKRIRIDDTDPDFSTINEDGSVKIEGDLMILAYDDMV